MISHEPTADVALLTPVPEIHLISGVEVCNTHGFVSYGTNAGLMLAEFQHMVGSETEADLLFYASHSVSPAGPRATYRGRFAGFDGARPNGKVKSAWSSFRPPTTANDDAFQGFYLVSNLLRLDVPIELSSLSKLKAKGRLAAHFVPLGPLIITTPF